MAGETARLLELQLGTPERDGASPVAAVLLPEHKRAVGVFRPPLARTELGQAAMWIDRAAFGEPGAMAAGRVLFSALLSGDVGALYDQARAEGGPIPLRLRLSTATATLPWELLWDPAAARYCCGDGVTRALSVPEGATPSTGVIHIAGEARWREDATTLEWLVLGAEEDPLDEARLAERVASAGTRVAVLSHVADTDVTSVDLIVRFAPPLLAAGLHAVVALAVGSRDPLRCPVLITLLEALESAEPVQIAAAAAVRAGHASESSDGIPVVAIRQPPRPVSGAVRARQLSREAGPLLKRSWKAGLAVIGGVLTVLALVDRVLPALQGPEPMDGSFNVAVADFDAQGGDDRDAVDAHAFAGEAADVLAEELSGLTDDLRGVQVRPPEQVGHIGGSDGERAAAAAALAEQINADLVLYGSFVNVDGRTTVTPQIYVSERRFPQAEELVGPHPLGNPLSQAGDVARNVIARADLQRRLADRTRSLAIFVVGLGHYALGDYEAAGSRFEQAFATGGWSGSGGAEVVLLFLGNSYGKLGSYDQARGSYEEALSITPEYARARLGLAELTFLEAAGECRGSVDVAGLDRAAQLFEEARDARLQPPLAFVRERATFGLARVHVCATVDGIADRRSEAESELEMVAAAYEGAGEHRSRLQETAAEAHGLLGRLALPYAATPDPTAAFRRALPEYRLAAELSTQPERIRLFWGFVARLHVLLEEDTAALEAYTAALGSSSAPDQRERYACAIDVLESTSSSADQRRLELDTCDSDGGQLPSG